LNSALLWRPTAFSDIIGQKSVVNQLTSFFNSPDTPQAFILTGMRGVGKTTARIISSAVNCTGLARGKEIEPCGTCSSCVSIKEGKFPDVTEIDGASNTGVDDVRRLIDSASYHTVIGKARVYIIDECHMLSRNAWNALLKTIEEPPADTYFILVTTEYGKIPDTIKSRCQTLFFKPVSFADLKQYLITKEVGLEQAELIASHSDGSVREALMLLDKISAVGFDNTSGTLGLESKKYISDLVEALINKQYHTLITLVEQAVSNGFDFARLCKMLTKFSIDFVVCAMTGSTAMAEVFGDFIESKKDLLAAGKIDGIKLFFKLFRLQQDLAYRNDKDLFLAGVIDAFYCGD
jgi:DNA polymerase-3 subunit gamma/tau